MSVPPRGSLNRGVECYKRSLMFTFRPLTPGLSVIPENELVTARHLACHGFILSLPQSFSLYLDLHVLQNVEVI